MRKRRQTLKADRVGSHRSGSQVREVFAGGERSNNMWCIIQVENHRDREILKVFGPYSSYEEAELEAERLFSQPENHSSYGEEYYFEVQPMSKSS